MTDADLVRLVDALEDRAQSYLTLDEVTANADAADVRRAVDDYLLLIDRRTRADGSSVTLCRLNRRHALVKELTGW